jgi:hypothetical protein
MSKQLETSWRNAFEYVQKFYLETSYLIKEVEGHLEKEPEKFAMCRGNGYAVTSYVSTQLDPKQVACWIPATIAVAFVPEKNIKISKGFTETPFNKSLRVLIMHVEVYWNEMERPVIHCGFLEKIKCKDRDLKRFEKLMFEFAYNPDEVFAKLPKIDYEDRYCSFAGQAHTVPLLSISFAQDVKDKLVNPMLKLYRK